MNTKVLTSVSKKQLHFCKYTHVKCVTGFLKQTLENIDKKCLGHPEGSGDPSEYKGSAHFQGGLLGDPKSVLNVSCMESGEYLGT